MLEAIGKDDPRLGAQKQRFNEFLDKAATKEDSDEVQREKKRVRFEGPEGGADIQTTATFRVSEKRSWQRRLEENSEFPKTTAERTSTKLSWKLPNGRPSRRSRF